MGIREEIKLTTQSYKKRAKKAAVKKEKARKSEIARLKREEELYRARARAKQAKESLKSKRHIRPPKIHRGVRRGKGKSASLLDLWG